MLLIPHKRFFARSTQVFIRHRLENRNWWRMWPSASYRGEVLMFRLPVQVCRRRRCFRPRPLQEAQGRRPGAQLVCGHRQLLRGRHALQEGVHAAARHRRPAGGQECSLVGSILERRSFPLATSLKQGRRRCALVHVCEPKQMLTTRSWPEPRRGLMTAMRSLLQVLIQLRILQLLLFLMIL